MQGRPEPTVRSRIRPAKGRRHLWRIDDERRFSLPVIVDHEGTDPATGARLWLIEATIDLVDGQPALVRMDARVPTGIDPYRMQREFRWASPLEIVVTGVPSLLARGIDPLAVDLPLSGFPEAATLQQPPNERLSDEFLEAIAREYLAIGRGYARTIAAERGVSQRTVVSWVEKARRRGILTRVPVGSQGGSIVAKGRRRPG